MPDTPGLRHVEHVMGTVLPFDIRDQPSPDIRDQPTPAIRRALAEAVTASQPLHDAGARHKRRRCALAVATSGIAERGHRIVGPHTGRPADTFASLTLVGPGPTLTDPYATVAFARGVEVQGRVETLDGHEAPAVLPGGRERRTTGFSRLGA
ncbi:hypothetical protein ACFY4I_12920 [Streptomyces scabiei]|uniref:hypothetical protein n=1 Tax=Streptomyces scabiei TaxID=1930 RepID=UPI0036CE4258